MKPVLFFILSLCSIGYANAQTSPAAFLSINAFLGKHTITMKEFSKSPGTSFGFSASVGIYAVNSQNYAGGLHLTLLEGASLGKGRRELSEKFELPNEKYDKHLFFNFAQFRSMSVGWFQEFGEGDIRLKHQVGLGIFGTTELDQLFDLGLHNTAGLLIGEEFSGLVGVSHNAQIGTGNPNYTMSNMSILIGGYRQW